MPDLSDSVNWSQTDANNNQAPPNGWPEGMMPSGVNDAARADKGALKRFWDKINPVQVITPAGVVWTFTTSNPAYPTAYVEGELYCFKAGHFALGGDQFQVNTLGPKPILKHVKLGAVSSTTWIPIVAHDFPAELVQLVYDASLNAGAGAFALINPQVLITGDGAGGVLVPAGGLAVTGGDLLLGRLDQAYSYVLRPNTTGFKSLGFSTVTGAPLDDVNVLTNKMEVSGQLRANGYSSHSGVGGSYQDNLFNIQWTPSAGAHLWIDTTDLGPIVTGSAGNVVIGGSATVGSLIVNGTADITGGLDVSGTVPGQPYTLIANGPVYTGNLAVTGTINASAGADISGTVLGQPYSLIVNGQTYTGPMTVSGDVQSSGAMSCVNGFTASAGAVVVGPGEGIAVGSASPIANSVNVSGTYYRGGVAIPVLTDAWMRQYEELVARVQVLEAALIART
jgi:hypothetical protein